MSLKDVVVGDRLVVESFGIGSYARYTVERLTNTQVICNGGAKFNRDTGRKVGSDSSVWGRKYARKMQDADFIKERIEIAKKGIERLQVTQENLEVVESFLQQLSTSGAAVAPR